MKKKIQIVLILFLSVIFMLGLCYIGLAVYYENGFSYGTCINGIYCTGKTVEEVDVELCQQYEYPGLDIFFPDGTKHISGEDISFSFDFMKPLSACLDRQNPYLWIENIFRGSDGITITPAGEYSSRQLETVCNNLIQSEPAKTGKVSLQMGTDGYFMVDTKKSVLNEEVFLTMVQNALVTGAESLDLMAEGGYKSLPYTENEKELLKIWFDLEPFLNKSIIVRFGEEQVPISKKILSDILKTDETGIPVMQDGVPMIDEEKTQLALNTLYDTYNTYRNHHFTTHDGNEIYIDTGNYGNAINMKKELKWFLAALTSEEQTILHEPEYSKEAKYKEKDDIGKTYIEIDMTAQQLFYYEDEKLILTTDVVTGNTGRRRGTPQMVCSVYGKQKNRTLRGPGYASFVNFWLPVSGNIGIHDASWRDAFGGNIYQTSGSHGCINTPYDNMKLLYDQVEVGTPVIVYYQNEDVSQ